MANSTTPPNPDDHVSTDGTSAEQEAVERQRNELREFVTGLSGDDIKSGNWFSKLLSQALGSYTTKVDAAYFRQKYPGVPADAVVDARIKMAANYAALEGGLSASAYTGAIAATIGTLGGASPLALPAAGVTLLVDVAFVTQLQLRLAYDVAVLYRVPIDLNDPDDVWKLIRVAFTIKSGEVAREGVLKVVPLVMRPLIRRFYSRSVLAAARGLPVVGRYLLQRNLIKIGIPVIGVPLSVVLNRYTTLLAGRHARAVFRNEARIIELAQRLSAKSRHPQTLLWMAWLTIMSDQKISADETLLLRYLIPAVRDEHGVQDDQLRDLVDVDHDEVWTRVDGAGDDITDLAEAAVQIAGVDADVNKEEQKIIDELNRRSGKTSASR